MHVRVCVCMCVHACIYVQLESVHCMYSAPITTKPVRPVHELPQYLTIVATSISKKEMKVITTLPHKEQLNGST